MNWLEFLAVSFAVVAAWCSVETTCVTIVKVAAIKHGKPKP